MEEATRLPTAPPHLIVCNWKTYLGVTESVQLAQNVVALARGHATELWIAPSTVALAGVSRVLQDSVVPIGAQNCFWEGKGPYTGECAVEELLELGCTFTIVGHSERRTLFGETSAMAAKRAHSALRKGLNVIYCVGESAPDRAANRTLDTIAAQLSPLFPCLAARPDQLLIAYEPVWAVGSGNTPTSAQIEEVHQLIAAHAASQHPGAKLRILYGGSVTSSNARALSHAPSVAGFLVGGASTKYESLKALLDCLG